MKQFGLVTLLAITTSIFSFKAIEEKSFEFSYPKRANKTFTFNAQNIKKFKKEWRGTDYYYFGQGKDGIICSVLFYKLNDDEKLSLIEAPKAATSGPDLSPAYPFAYFSNFSNLKKYEEKNESWGQATDDFMFRQNDISSFNGVKISQKHMYGYGMADKDLFINIHLSKTECSATDSTTMREILNSLRKVN